MTAADREQLETDGYVVLRGVLPERVLQPVRDALTAVVDRMSRRWQEQGLLQDRHEDAPFEQRWTLVRAQVPALRPVTWRRVLVSPAMHALWRTPELTGPLRSVLGDELWAMDTWNGRPREPHAPVQRITWHQDQFYLRGWEPADGHVLTCWIPLVPVPVHAGCLQVVPGSHRFGVLRPRLDGFRTKNVPVEALRGVEPVTLPAEPGDVVVFTESTLHQALDNESDHVRWTVDIRFGADSPAVRRKAPGGFLCRTAGDPRDLDDEEAWLAKWDREHGAMATELRAIDAAAARSGEMARDITTY